MKRIAVSKTLVALIVVAALASVAITSRHTVPPVYAGSGCSNATLNGSYAAIQPAGFTTTSASNSSNEVPWQFVAVVTFDGHGGLSADWTAAVNGAISGPDLENAPQHATGSYTVHSDCKGSFSLVGPDDAGGTANLAVIGGGAELLGIWTNSGSTATFDAKKQ